MANARIEEHVTVSLQIRPEPFRLSVPTPGRTNWGFYCVNPDCGKFMTMVVLPKDFPRQVASPQANPPQRHIEAVCPHCRYQQRRLLGDWTYKQVG